jgi:predicted nucleotidyltransferase
VLCGESFFAISHKKKHEKITGHEEYKGISIQEKSLRKTQLIQIKQNQVEKKYNDEEEYTKYLINKFYSTSTFHLEKDEKGMNTFQVIYNLMEENLYKGVVKIIGLQLLKNQLEKTKQKEEELLKKIVIKGIRENQDLELIQYIIEKYEMNKEMIKENYQTPTKTEMSKVKEESDKKIKYYENNLVEVKRGIIKKVEEEVYKNYEEMRVGEGEGEKRMKVIKMLEKYLIDELNVKLELIIFGSFSNNLYSLDSDVDVCLKLENENNFELIYNNQILFKIKNILSNNFDKEEKNIYEKEENFEKNKEEKIEKNNYEKEEKKLKIKKIEIITNSKIPVLKCKINEINIDIILYKESNIKKKEYLQNYIDYEPKIIPLIYYLKKYKKSKEKLFFSNEVCISSDGYLTLSYNKSLYFTNYCLNMMLLFFLQQKGLVPVIEIDHLNFKKLIGRNEVDFNVGEVLLEFFLFYIHFDYSNVVSVRLGDVISKSFSKILKSKNVMIEDPFEIDQNIARNINYQKDKFITSLKKDFVVLIKP